MDSVKILHTADIHIGASFEAFGGRGAEHREAVKNAFSTIVEKAAEDKYDLLMIVGDLFDSAYGVTERDISSVLGKLRDLSGTCSVLILPGSHDFWGPGSIYEMNLERFESIEGVSVMIPERESVTYPELDLIVHGKALLGGKSSENPLQGLKPDPAYRWNIAVAHGSVVSAMNVKGEVDIPIRLDEVERGFDYIALGHWHSYREINTEAPPILYCGSPELIARDQKGSGYVVSVELSETDVKYEKERVGRVRVESVTIDSSVIHTTEDLVREVTKQIEPDRFEVIELSFTGLLDLDASVDFDAAIEELSRAYFSIVVEGALPHRRVTRAELDALPGDTVVGKFAEILFERIEDADEKERSACEEALQIGLQLFKGNNPLG